MDNPALIVDVFGWLLACVLPVAAWVAWTGWHRVSFPELAWASDHADADEANALTLRRLRVETFMSEYLDGRAHFELGSLAPCPVAESESALAFLDHLNEPTPEVDAAIMEMFLDATRARTQ